MKYPMLTFLDYFFIAFHSLFTLFNMTGWIWKKTRKAHLTTILLTACSWFVLGIWYGWGYCFCTDWHWQVREALGRPITSDTYIHFLILDITGVNLPPRLVDAVTLAVFVICFFLSVTLNARDFAKQRSARETR
ncbi:MAG: hypothetical protein A2176_08670 [Spirochaetes bacterium RBG_13_51_14]|nr:MAG: hypothetical protein A2176_08670 [Spirochaetes bacterium RBG_13_51_14]